jgi:hypothetical protein
MKTSHPVSILVMAALLLTACGPVVMVPGVRLGGAEVIAPDSWADVEVPEEVLLRTEGGVLPRVHRIWAAKGEGGILVAGEATSSWIERAIADPNVQLRMGDDVYALRAERVIDPDAQRRAVDIFIAKYREGMIRIYGEEPDAEEMARESVLFRLDRR